jgi:hypothetical protein
VIPIVETPTAKIEEEQPIVPNKEVVNVPLKSSDLLAVNNVPTSNSDVSKIENLLIYKIQNDELILKPLEETLKLKKYIQK